MHGYTRETVKEDIPYLAVNLRTEDRAEILASSGLKPEIALEMGLMLSRRCRTICMVDGTPAGIYGVSDTTVRGLGSIWMLATPDLLKVQRQFLRECREGISEVSQGYSCVFNYTDARNAVHHKWLRWCGFTFIKEHKNFGKQNETFYEFVKITEGLPNV